MPTQTAQIATRKILLLFIHTFMSIHSAQKCFPRVDFETTYKIDLNL